jgi:hypothetical protein
MQYRRIGKQFSWIAGVFLGTGALIAVQHGAAAQNTQRATSSTTPSVTAPGEVRTGPLPAPVGHRQVRPSDLPPDATKIENRAEQNTRDFDAKLRICKGC